MTYSRPFLKVDGLTPVKVENLSSRTSSTILREIFEDFGPINDVYIPSNYITGESCGFAFINFYNKCDAEDAIRALDGISLDGNKLKVQMFHNNGKQHAKPSCSQGTQQRQYKEENNKCQRHSERHCCSSSTLGIPTRSQSRSPLGLSLSQSHYLSHRSFSNNRSRSSVSRNHIPARFCQSTRRLQRGGKEESKFRSPHNSVPEIPDRELGLCKLINYELRNNLHVGRGDGGEGS